jgi:hypothetical protein
VICKKFLALTPEGLILDWLAALEEQNNRYQRWQNQAILTEQDLYEDGIASLKIPYKIPTQLVPRMYAKAKHVAALLSENPVLTHLEILRSVQPSVARVYEQAIADEDSPERAYSQVPHIFFGEPRCRPRSMPFQTPAEAASCFLKRLQWENMPNIVKVKLIGTALRSFPGHVQKFPSLYVNVSRKSLEEIFLLAVEHKYIALAATLLEEERFSQLNASNSISLISSRNSKGQTALLLACLNADEEMIRLLISYGADAQAVDLGGRNALKLCIMTFPSKSLKKLLLQFDY